MRLGKSFKRLLDLVLGFTALLLLSPVFLALIIAVGINAGRPLIFAQTRPGRLARPFCIYKFRTMSNECDPEGNLLPDHLRLSAFGKFLRSSSMDELPELLNVLKGNMSLVGPRPLLMQYLERYTPEQARRHEMKPGITGWAQINGRNAISWEEKFALDIWYIDNWSFTLDLKILVFTVVRVLSRQGSNAPGEATMPEFIGIAPPCPGNRVLTESGSAQAMQEPWKKTTFEAFGEVC